MSCLNNIIGIRSACATDEAPLSGLYLTDYPGITIQSASNVADEKTKTGHDYLVDLRRRAMIKLNADIQSHIATNYRSKSFVSNSFGSGDYNVPYATIAAGTAGQRRGLVIGKLKTWCRFHKIVINRIRIYSAHTGDIALHIADVYGGVTYTPTVSLEAGVIKEFELNKVIQGNEVQITVPSDILVYSSKPDCGCGGRPKNEYFVFNGLSNTTVVASESYGVTCDVSLKCDFSTLVCDLVSDGIMGMAAFELCGAMFYDEMTKNNRVNYLTIYNSDQIREQAIAGFAAYKERMESAMSGFARYLTTMDGNCGCIDCGGVQVKSNI